jgi:HEAT repeat protein
MKALDDPEPAVREACAWALRRIRETTNIDEPPGSADR